MGSQRVGHNLKTEQQSTKIFTLSWAIASLLKKKVLNATIIFDLESLNSFHKYIQKRNSFLKLKLNYFCVKDMLEKNSVISDL